MFAYWLLFSFFVVGALFRREMPGLGVNPAGVQGGGAVATPPGQAGPVPQIGRRQLPRRRMLAVGALIIALMVGLRFEVGADWESYQFQFRQAGKYSLESFVPKFGDPAYNFISWNVRNAGVDIWLVNLIGGLIFGWGLLQFARAQRDPWLTMVVAVPYLVIVVAMGYSRQGMAIGVLLAGLAAVHRGASTLRFGLYCAVAALFHRSAVVLFPLVALASGRTRSINLLITLAVGLLFYDLFLASSAALLRQRYVEGLYSSQGAVVRILLNIVPAVLYLAFERRFGFSDVERKLWRYFSIAACLLAVALALSPSSTAVDRIALYIIPLQLAILPRAPEAFNVYGVGRTMVIVYSASILLVWLNFARHAEDWIPYRVFPIWQ